VLITLPDERAQIAADIRAIEMVTALEPKQ
jgi:hypothetical protein